METIQNIKEKNTNNFYKVPEMAFDINKLRTDLENILKKKKFWDGGITNFGAIPMNQIPNDSDSIKGHKNRGVYWTIADESGKEVTRDVNIEEEKYTELLPEFRSTYFAEVYKSIKSKI